MLTNLEKNIKLNAHYAAQKTAEHFVLNEYDNCNKPKSKAYVRKQVLNLLEKTGFARFMVNKCADLEAISLQSYSYQQTEADESYAWFAREKYSVTEVTAYLEFLGQSNVTPQDCVDYLTEEYGFDPFDTGPGKAFSSGRYFVLSKSKARIVAYTGGGLDV
jgi:hypothetical protein